VSPEKQSLFQDIISSEDIESKLLADNLERLLEIERRTQKLGIEKHARTGFSKNTSIPLDHFWTHDEINEYIDYLAVNYKDIVQVSIIGRSIEHRRLRAVKVSLSGRVDGKRPIIFIDAGLHAREWAAHMTAVYLLYQLVERHTEHSADFLRNVDWIIVPMVNPDGYVYSHENQRLWRKNRRIYPNCTGVDINRNFGHHFVKTTRCNMSFSGPFAFSEPETRAIRNLLLRYRRKIKLYTSLHTYGGFVLYPWGFAEELISNWEEHDDLGVRFADAVANKWKNIFAVGNSAKLLYPASGASDDYAVSTGIPISFTVELDTNAHGQHGFELPVTRINEIVTETFAGLREFGRYIADKWN